METIASYSHYTKLMRNGFYDKLFFVDKLIGDWHTLADYGCADGFLTKLIGNIFPDKQIVGFDEDPKMVDRARFTGEARENVSFSTSQEMIYRADVLYLSSIIHEVFAYKTKEEVEDFFFMMFSERRRMIIVRDMLYSPEAYELVSLNIDKYSKAIYNCSPCPGYEGELGRFEDIYGPISVATNLIHWLLKYPYIGSPNWTRELNENYLLCSYNRFKSFIPDGWREEYVTHAPIPYLQNKWEEDFGIFMPIETHSKIILKRTK